MRGFGELEKKQLLQFITGSDRIPIGGLAKLKFVIVKNGPDSDRSAQQCFILECATLLYFCNTTSKWHVYVNRAIQTPTFELKIL